MKLTAPIFRVKKNVFKFLADDVVSVFFVRKQGWDIIYVVKSLALLLSLLFLGLKFYYYLSIYHNNIKTSDRFTYKKVCFIFLCNFHLK